MTPFVKTRFAAAAAGVALFFLTGALPEIASGLAHRPRPPVRGPGGSAYYVVGNSADVRTTTRGGLVLQGGGTDIESSFRWMIERSGGGDFLVLRTEGDDSYNDYIAGLGGDETRPDSVATLVIPSREAASDPAVAARIGRAEALWISGGDQAEYVRFWKGTPVAGAIQAAIAGGVPVGGTSSGLAVLGGVVYSAEHDPVPRNDLTSRQTLSDPYGFRVTLVRDYLAVPLLGGLILDSHFVQRDRMGRLVGFLGRIAQEGWSGEARGIGVDRQTALLVEPDGRATVIGHPNYPRAAAYFLRLHGRPAVCRAGAPLDARDVEVVRVPPGGAFDLRDWKGLGTLGDAYTLSVRGGRMASSHEDGRIYGLPRWFPDPRQVGSSMASR